MSVGTCPPTCRVPNIENTVTYIEGTVARLEAGQQQMISLMTQMASVSATLASITKEFSECRSQSLRDHDDLFTRLRKAETDISLRATVTTVNELDVELQLKASNEELSKKVSKQELVWGITVLGIILGIFNTIITLSVLSHKASMVGVIK